MKEIIGNIAQGQDKKIGIVVAQFNGVVTDRLLSGALEQLKKSGEIGRATCRERG